MAIGHEANHSPQSSAEVKFEWSYTPILYMTSWYGHGKPDLFSADICMRVG